VNFNEPLVRQREHDAKQAGMSEEGALRHALGKGAKTPTQALKSSTTPPGHKLVSMEARGTNNGGVIVKHNFERKLSNTQRKGDHMKGAPETDTLSTMSPQEHAFSSTQDASDHIDQHLGELANRDDDNASDGC
jgi:hypothetical protein